jgi:hypothetical protein
VLELLLEGQDISFHFPLPRYLSWDMIFAAVAWNQVTYMQREAEERTMIALAFCEEYGADAPFIAASMLFDFHIHTVSEEEQHRATCFMSVFVKEQQDWYDHDAWFEVDAVSGCRCLPRHYQHCTKQIR